MKNPLHSHFIWSTSLQTALEALRASLTTEGIDDLQSRSQARCEPDTWSLTTCYKRLHLTAKAFTLEPFLLAYLSFYIGCWT